MPATTSEPADRGPDAARGVAAGRRFGRLLLVLAVLLGAYFAAVSVVVGRHGAWRQETGWSGRLEDGAWRVAKVTAGGPAAGVLAPGDVILAVNGIPVRGKWLLPYHVSIQGLAPYAMHIRRGTRESTLTLRPVRVHAPGQLARVVQVELVSAVFCAMAIFVGFARPADRLARLLCGALLGFGMNLLFWVLPFEQLLLTSWERLLRDVPYLLFPMHYPLGYHFLYRYPTGLPRRQPWSALIPTFYAWALLVWASSNAFVHLLFWRPDLAVPWAPAFVWLNGRVFTPLFLAAAVASIAVLVSNYRIAGSSRDQIGRIRVLLLSTAAAVTPAILKSLLEIIDSLGPHDVLGSRLYEFVLSQSLWLPVLIPVGYSYAILKHQMLDIRVVLRQSLKYVLARRVLQAAVSLPLVLLLAGAIANRDRTIAQIVSSHPSFLALAALAALALRFRATLERTLDRRFFRESPENQPIFLALIAGVRRCESLAELPRLVAEAIDAAFHPSRIHVFYEDPSRPSLVLGHSSGGGEHGLDLPEDTALLRAVAADGRVRQLVGAPLPAEERRTLAALGACLAVPIGGGERRLRGLILLGERKSEEPYSPADLRLLEALSTQVAIVHENLAMSDRLERQDRVQRDVFAHLAEAGFAPMHECPACGACYDDGGERCPVDGAEVEVAHPIERTIAGRYRLERRIGRGGMGSVYRATDLGLRRPVAVKILSSSLLGNRTALRRFEREARLVANLHHPGIVTLHDYGELGSRGAYLVMELLEGRSLRDELETAGALAPARAAEVFAQIFSAVRYAHERGIVHRDLKPDNVFLTEGAAGGTEVKVLDFGIARLNPSGADAPTELTALGVVVGTLLYASPEQLGGDDVDARSDVFSLGVMLFEALTARHPFASQNRTQIVSAILHRTVRFPGEGPARAMRDALDRCLEKDPRRRLASVAELEALALPALAIIPPGLAASWASIGAQPTTAGLGESSGEAVGPASGSDVARTVD